MRQQDSYMAAIMATLDVLSGDKWAVHGYD